MIDINIIASSSKGNAYLVTDGKTKLLLECGVSFRKLQVALDFRLSEVAGCLISHEHGDHSKSVKDLLKSGITVYTSEGTAQALNLTHHGVKTLIPMKQISIGTWTILPFETQHDAAEPLGFLLANEDGDKLVFITDSYFVEYVFQGLTHVMVEANYAEDILEENIASGKVPVFLRNRLSRSHFSLENLKDFLKANDLSKVQQIYLLHLSDSNSDADRFKREIAELTGKEVYVADA